MHNVEACEADPRQSFQVNAVGTRNLAQISETLGARFVHVSTDYVFDGTKGSPYVETDVPRPLNVYANSKLAGEYFARSEATRHFVVRVSGLFGDAPCRAKGGRNFVTTMLKLSRERDEVRVVDDEFVSPTYTLDAARQLLHLLATHAYGIYHVTGTGACSWYEYAAKIFDLTGAAVKLSKARPNEFPAKVPRPMYTVLDNAAMRRQGLPPMPTWQDALQRFLRQLG
jgi:dTDP-4-dehydrorhamnose reductase